MRVIIATGGKYSDYSIKAVLEWLRGTPEEARDIWLEAHPEQRKEYEFEEYEFISWLISEGYAQDLEAEELHLEDYSSVEEWERRPYARESGRLG